MNLSMFDQSKKDPSNLTFEGEAVRLSNELRSQPTRSFINLDGVRVDVPAKQGFDCETADFMTMVNWLADTRIKKSESLISFVHRILAARFSTAYAQHKDKINARYKLEYEMIQSNATKDIAWLGSVGFQNSVRLDGSLTNPNVKVEKLRNDRIQIIKT